MLYVRLILENETQVVFECCNPKPAQREFIAIDLSTGDKEMRVRKQLVIEYLKETMDREQPITWLELDLAISRIITANIHTV